jgi:hypothetical protein
MSKANKTYEVVEQTGPVPLTSANLVMEVEREDSEIKWMAKRLSRNGLTYSITKDTAGVILDERDRVLRRTVIYRLYSNVKDFFTPSR